MLPKALWKKDFKQTKGLFIYLGLVFIFWFPIQALLRIDGALETLREEQARGEDHHLQFLQTSSYFWEQLLSSSSWLLALLLLAVIPGVLIGSERNSETHHVMTGLPFKRQTLFISKFVVGAVGISLLFFFAIGLAYIFVAQSELSFVTEQFSLLEHLWLPWTTMLAIFALGMLMGSLVGEMLSQIVLTLIFLIFPSGFWLLVRQFIEINNIPLGGEQWQAEFVGNVTLPLILLDGNMNGWFIIPAVMTIVFAVVGTYSYASAKDEHNGELLLFKKLNVIFLPGVVVCFALLGGMIAASIAPHSQQEFQVILYWIGAVLLGSGAYFSTRRLLQMNRGRKK
ncbi:ABC-2 type transport system permease protein [Salsuginibacillus halophilus]|uniref:ABC-2 type transport system permease protein n=1 Tax=Salsuginibacillus halophilus TaxID=517424 RepID=A0A2P8HBF8_9BACI|nr:ABC transporter permease subunit [Salsuginibacillus halophilus]PSL43560.1 ABC-2 type transport system permease protein [Salsuginibacillus halophilus]